MRKFLIEAILVLAVVGSSAKIGLTENTSSPLEISIASLADHYSLGDPMVFTVYFRNISSEKIYVIKGDYIYPQCRLVVTDSQGHELSYDPAPGCNEVRCLDLGPAPVAAYMAILPGQDVKYFTFSAIAGRELGSKFNWWSAGREAGPYPFKAIGTYKVGFQYVNPSPAHPNGLKGISGSNTIKVVVGEQNERWGKFKPGQTKEEIIELLGEPDYETSGLNVIGYYDRENKQILSLIFDQWSKLVRYEKKKTDKFPESPIEPQKGISREQALKMAEGDLQTGKLGMGGCACAGMDHRR